MAIRETTRRRSRARTLLRPSLSPVVSARSSEVENSELSDPPKGGNAESTRNVFPSSLGAKRGAVRSVAQPTDRQPGPVCLGPTHRGLMSLSENLSGPIPAIVDSPLKIGGEQMSQQQYTEEEFHRDRTWEGHTKGLRARRIGQGRDGRLYRRHREYLGRCRSRGARRTLRIYSGQPAGED